MTPEQGIELLKCADRCNYGEPSVWIKMDDYHALLALLEGLRWKRRRCPDCITARDAESCRVYWHGGERQPVPCSLCAGTGLVRVTPYTEKDLSDPQPKKGEA